MSSLPTTAARTAALAAHGKFPCTVLELTVDRCSNTYGVAPCTAAGAAGSECYNTYSTCQDRPNYTKSSQTLKFVSRGVMSPPGVDLRPYLLNSISAPTALDFEAGLAPRNVVAISLADETDNDSGQDPYYATRATPAGGTWWTRWIARNKNYVGRTAKLRRGFVASPWNWDLFLDELYTIDQIGIDTNGQIKITLKDPLKLADNNTIPLPTSGALQADLKSIENAGMVVAATSTTVDLATDASAVDSAYVGMEVYIYSGVGAGQRRVITGYVGSTRRATVAAWAVTPTTSSAYQVSGLSITVDSGKGGQYANPATSGKNEYIRIGGEIIRYTAKAGDVLSWPDAAHRAQFGSVREDHNAGDTAQLCRAFVNQPMADVLTDLLTESDIPSGYLSPDITTECSIWYGSTFNVTACISAPEKVSGLLKELLTQIDAVMWWSPQNQKIEFKAIMPTLDTILTLDDESGIIQGSMGVKSLDTLRITQAAMSYAMSDAAANMTEARNFLATDVVVNTDAQSTNEYGDKRPLVTRSRWFGDANSVAMLAVTSRKVNRRYDAPKLFTFKIDPKDYTKPIGSIVAVKSHKHVDVTGQPKAESCFVTSLNDKGTHVEMQARSLNFAKRYAFIAPSGYPNFNVATDAQKQYAFIAGTGGTMSDGSEPYRII